MIHIEKDWYIDSDKYCYVLGRYLGKKESKDGKEVEVWADQKYYATLKKALAGYYRIKTKELLSEKDLEIYDAIKMLEKELNKIETLLINILKDDE